MKKWKRYALAAALLLSLIRSPGRDVGELEPAEVVQIRTYQNLLTIRTETGQLGIGNTIQSALEDLNRTAERTVFLETAGYLLIDGNTLGNMNEVQGLLRPNCKMCLAEETFDDPSEFLRNQKLTYTIRDFWKGRTPVPILRRRSGRMYLE